MRKKIIIAIVAVLVMGVATAALARDGRNGSEHGARTAGHNLVEQVLGDLVQDGTITGDQSAAIVAALEARKAEVRATARAGRAQLRAFLEDGVLTSAEIARLPFADRFTDSDGPFADALEDGQITQAELDEIRSDRRERREDPGHHRGGEHRDSSENS